MITGAIVFVLVIAMIASGGNGEWGSVAIGAVIVVALLFFRMVGRDSARAYNNFIDHWSKDERDRW